MTPKQFIYLLNLKIQTKVCKFLIFCLSLTCLFCKGHKVKNIKKMHNNKKKIKKKFSKKLYWICFNLFIFLYIIMFKLMYFMYVCKYMSLYVTKWVHVSNIWTFKPYFIRKLLGFSCLLNSSQSVIQSFSQLFGIIQTKKTQQEETNHKRNNKKL